MSSAKDTIGKACTEAIAAILPAGTYPLDVAIIDNAAQALYQQIMEIVGEDEAAYATVSVDPTANTAGAKSVSYEKDNSYEIRVQNQLRAELRRKLAAYFGREAV